MIPSSSQLHSPLPCHNDAGGFHPVLHSSSVERNSSKRRPTRSYQPYLPRHSCCKKRRSSSYPPHLVPPALITRQDCDQIFERIHVYIYIYIGLTMCLSASYKTYPLFIITEYPLKFRDLVDIASLQNASTNSPTSFFF